MMVCLADGLSCACRGLRTMASVITGKRVHKTESVLVLPHIGRTLTLS